MTRKNALWLAAFAVVACGAVVTPATASITWAHLAHGMVLLHHDLPSPLGGTVEPHAPGTSAQWLFDIPVALAYLASGIRGLSLLAALATGASLFLVASRNIRWPLVTVICIAAYGITARFALGAQPTTVALIATAAILLILDRWVRRGTAWIAAIPVIYLALANATPLAIPALLFLIAAVIAPLPGRKNARRTIALVAALSVAATFLTPGGLSLWGGELNPVVNGGTSAGLLYAASPNFHYWSMRIPEALTVVFGFLLALSTIRSTFRCGAYLVACVLFLQAGMDIVFVLPVVLCWVGPVTEDVYRNHIAPAIRTVIPRLPRVIDALCSAGPGAAASLVAIAAGAVICAVSVGESALPTLYPVSGLQELERTVPPGTVVYAPPAWENFIAASTSKLTPVFTGDETDFTPSEMNAYQTISNVDPNWAEALAETNATAAIIPKNEQEISLFQSLGWRAVCLDTGTQSIVMVADPGSTRDIVTLPAACRRGS